MPNRLVLTGFKGAATSVAPHLLPSNVATETRNLRSEDGSLRVRNGIRSIAASFSGAPKGLHLSHGHDNSNNFVEEYVGFRESGGSVKPFSINVNTGAGTEITDGGTPLSLTNAEWMGCNFYGYGYYLTPGGTVYKHQVGDNTSWSALDPGQPNQFLTNQYPRLEFSGEDSGNTVTAGAAFSWAGHVAGGFAVNGGSMPMSYVGPSGSSLELATNKAAVAYTPGSHWIDVDLDMSAATAGAQDWSSAIGIQFTLAKDDGTRWVTGATEFVEDWPWAIGSGNAQIWIENTAGTAVEQLTGGVQTIISPSGDVSYRFILTIPVGVRGSNWTSTKILRVRLPALGNYTGTDTTDHTFSISQITVDAEGGTATTPDTSGLRFGAVAFNEEQGTEAVNPTFSIEVQMAVTGKSRYYGSTQASTFLGNICTVNITDAQMTTLLSAPGVTHIRYYVAFMDEGTPSKYTMRLMDELEVGDAEAGMYQVPYTYEELRALPLRDEFVGRYESLGTPKCMVAYRQWMVYGYAGGAGNIKHSRVGQPYALASLTDDAGGGDLPEDTNRGATFTLSDNFADEPVTMLGTEASLYIFGRKGVYVQSGKKPYILTPPRRVPGALGVMGFRAACNWRDLNGVEGCAYVSADGENVWFVVAAANFSNLEPSFSLVELTEEVRGQLKSFLFNGSTPTADKVYIFHEGRDDALWVCYENRAMVLRRKNTFQKQRTWEFYEYNLSSGTLRDWATGLDHGIRVLKSDGSLYEAERNKSTGFTQITGTGRDDGGNVPSGRYWKSKVFTGGRRRCFRARVERETVSETVDVKVITDREPAGQTITVASGDKFKRFGQFAIGQNHQYQLTVTEGQAGVRVLEIEETATGPGYNQ